MKLYKHNAKIWDYYELPLFQRFLWNVFSIFDDQYKKPSKTRVMGMKMMNDPKAGSEAVRKLCCNHENRRRLVEGETIVIEIGNKKYNVKELG